MANFFGTPVGERFDGTAGNDLMFGDGGNDTLLGGFGGNDQLFGDSGNDELIGGNGNDTLYGGEGNDILNGFDSQNGSDVLFGGTGDDTYRIDSAGDAIAEGVNAGIDTVITGATNFTLGTNFENLTSVAGGSANLTGNELNNEIRGSISNDTLNGLDGTDLLDGGNGNDNLQGGNNNDTLVGGNGNDLLNGNAGIDSMVGGAGNDTYVVDNFEDVVTEGIGGNGSDTVNSTISFTLGNGFEKLTLVNTGSAFQGTGNEDANQITSINFVSNFLEGLGGNDTLDGGFGNDTLDGGTGIDSLIGGIGNDTYIVDNSSDIVTENANEGLDTVQSSATFTLIDADVENLTLLGTTAINGTGNGNANAITGNNAANTLDGLLGNDTLIGGGGDDLLLGGGGIDRLRGQAGNDVLNGQAGSDHYVFSSTSPFAIREFGQDTIEVFAQGSDKIVLSKLTFELQSSVGNGFSVGADFAVVANDTAADDSAARIVYSAATNNLFFNQNGNVAGFGSDAQGFQISNPFATITTPGDLVLTANDFIVEA